MSQSKVEIRVGDAAFLVELKKRARDVINQIDGYHATKDVDYIRGIKYALIKLAKLDDLGDHRSYIDVIERELSKGEYPPEDEKTKNKK